MLSSLHNKLIKFSQRGLRFGSPSAYAFALACVTTASMTSLTISHIVENVTESIAFYPAIFVAALFGGVRAGALAAVCGALVLWWIDTDFLGDSAAPRAQFINLGLYIISSALSIWAAKSLRRASNRLRPARERPTNSEGSVIVHLPNMRPAKFDFAHKIGLLRREGLHPNSLAAYALSLACVAFATFVRFGIGWFSSDILPFACYYPAILIVSLVGGLEAGLVTTVLSLIVVGWAFVPPYYSIGLPTPDQVVDCELFLFASMVSVWLIERHRYATVRVGRDVPVKLESFTPIVVTFGLVLLTTLVVLVFESMLGAQYLVLSYLVPTTIIAILYGNKFAVLTSFGGGFAAAYFLFPPKFSLYIEDPVHFAALTIYILIALAVSKVASLLTYGTGFDNVGGHRENSSLFFSGNADRGRTGILLIHSVGGTPHELKSVATGLADRGYTVSCCQLAGHGKSEEDLLNSSWTDWFSSAEKALADLEKQCDIIVVGGLSVGSMLALRLAALHPTNVHGLCLFAPTLRYNGWAIPWYSFLLILGVRTPFLRRMRFTDPAPYGIKDEATRALIADAQKVGRSTGTGSQFTSLGTLQESHKLVRDVSWRLPSIKAPALIIHPRDDDVSDLSNTIYLQRRLGGLVECVVLDDSYHLITVDRQRDVVMNETAGFLEFVERLAVRGRPELARSRPTVVAGREHVSSLQTIPPMQGGST
jgi:carboxylesterase